MSTVAQRIASILNPQFDGVTYDAARDQTRLFKALEAVKWYMRKGDWHTLYDISVHLGIPEASVSARLRDLRKPKFGGYTVEKKYLSAGLWVYRVVPK